MKLLLPLLIVLLYTANAHSKTVNVVAGIDKPPYVYQENGKAAGFEIELIEQLFQQMGLTPVFHLTPYGRSMRMLKKPGVDAVMTASAAVFKDKTILTKPYINYQNVVVSLAKRNIELTDVRQLQNYSIAAFQTASQVLGYNFTNSTELSPYYTEVPEQKRQLLMLKQNKVDTLVMDVNIFNHFKTQNYPDTQFAKLFPISFYGMAFKDPDLVKRFNRTWAEYRKSEQYQILKQKYQMQQRF